MGGCVEILVAMTDSLYCETHKTVNTRNIYGMLLCCEKLTNEARDNDTANSNGN